MRPPPLRGDVWGRTERLGWGEDRRGTFLRTRRTQRSTSALGGGRSGLGSRSAACRSDSLVPASVPFWLQPSTSVLRTRKSLHLRFLFNADTFPAAFVLVLLRTKRQTPGTASESFQTSECVFARGASDDPGRGLRGAGGVGGAGARPCSER